MHQDYNFFIPLTSKKDKFQPQTNILLGKTFLFLLNLTVEWVEISEKIPSVFLVLDLVTTGQQIERNLFCH